MDETVVLEVVVEEDDVTEVVLTVLVVDDVVPLLSTGLDAMFFRPPSFGAKQNIVILITWNLGFPRAPSMQMVPTLGPKVQK